MKAFARFLPAASVFLIPTLLQAHPGHGSGGFLQGIGHPVLGFDHILAMVAVGVWAAQMGGRGLYLVPAAFVASMTLGAALAWKGITVPFIEQGLVVSVFMLGLFIAVAAKIPAGLASAVVGLFAAFHGNAHGAEMPGSLSPFSYAAGFILTTIALHAAGIAGSGFVEKYSRSWLRASGVLIALFGVYLGVAL